MSPSNYIIDTGNVNVSPGLAEFPHSKAVYLDQGNFTFEPGAEIYCSETNDSPVVDTSDSAPTTSTRKCIVVGTLNIHVVRSILTMWLNGNKLWSDGNCPLRSVNITPDSTGALLWTVTLNYGGTHYDFNKVELSFSTVGGTAHVTQATTLSPKHYACFGQPVRNHFGAIGLNNSGEYEGIEVKRPALQFTISQCVPSALFDFDTIRMLSNVSAHVNANTFLGFPPGEVLFEGADGELIEIANQTDFASPYFFFKVTYRFIHSPTIDMPPVGGFPGYRKLGWEAVWTEFDKYSNDQGEVLSRPRQINVDEVYLPANFGILNINTQYLFERCGTAFN